MLTRMFTLYKQANPNELTLKEFKDLEKVLKHPDTSDLSDQLLDFLLWSKGLPSRQQSLAEFLSKKLCQYPDAKILEVGCGRTAILSRILSKKGFHITCMDKIVDSSTTEGIPTIKDEFDYRKIDLSEYDIVIGQEPCDATEHIVRACIAQNKLFFISLCGSPHKIIGGDIPKTYQEWFNHLLKISDGYSKLVWISLDPLSKTPILKSKAGL